MTELNSHSPFAPAGDPLALDVESMRALGHRMVDEVVDLMTDPSTPALRRAAPAEMAGRLPTDPPESARSFDSLLAQLREDVFPYMSRLDHPGYFAFIPACGTFPGALGDFMASALNPYVGTWMEAAGPSRLELVVLDWFKNWIGYPAEAGGVLVSGGSAANMTALACAREALLGPMSDSAVAYVCDQGHSSLARAARAAGLPTRPGARAARRRDRRPARCHAGRCRSTPTLDAGRKPLFVAGVAGATNTGAVDPLADLAAVCKRARRLVPRRRRLRRVRRADRARSRACCAGIEQADSVTLDPHKWLYQPFECGSLLVRDGRHAAARVRDRRPTT